MNYVRLYVDDRGESHLEDVPIPAAAGGTQRGIADMIPAQGIVFRTGKVGDVIDWHTAPRRQILVNLRGEWEIEASDGDKRRIGPGVPLLVEDLTGKGHVTRTVGTVDRVTMIVPLAE
ncbi:MAG TPA: hypothetical protein VHL09_04100 [Dehalococcoidia bacterium]|nr:hypothetical protein [Dehalococcoidia bacterium]